MIGSIISLHKNLYRDISPIAIITASLIHNDMVTLLRGSPLPCHTVYGTCAVPCCFYCLCRKFGGCSNFTLLALSVKVVVYVRDDRHCCTVFFCCFFKISLTALLVVIELVNGTSAPVTAFCTVLYTLLIEVHHIRVLEKQHRRQDGRIEGFS